MRHLHHRLLVIAGLLALLLTVVHPTTIRADDAPPSTTETTKNEDSKADAKPAEQPNVKTDAKPKPKKKAETEKKGDEDKPEPGVMRRFEKRVDKVAKWCADGIASVLFYEVVGGRSIELPVDAAQPSVDDIRRLLKQVEAEGLDPKELDYSLSLPPLSLSKDDTEKFQSELNEELTAGRTRGFSVSVRDEPDNGKQDSGKVTLTATRRGFPIVVLWLVLGATFFTVRMGFINFRGFKHAVDVTRGRYDNPEDEGEVTHFQALTSALSATVGLGNIAGVALAVSFGGPGAVFWMIIAGVIGMTAKFVECTLGQMYRSVRTDGRIMGGAMFYLQNGLAEMGLGPIGRVLGVLFAVLCVLASFGGGNAFQVNQSLNAVQATVPVLADYGWVYGLVMAVLVGVVIIGGIRRIAVIAEKIVPFMCGVYVLACLWILLMNALAIPGAIGTIIGEAFTPRAGYGAMLGVLVMGFRRAAFSNEAGVGSAAIAHSAAKTDYPVREGLVALLGPFIDTVVICTMTALVMVITGAYDGVANPEYAELIAQKKGAGLTSQAMGSQISWFPYVLSIAVVMFAYSTMISWSYYGERCWAYLFGDRASLSYRLIFVGFVFLGSVMSARNVLDLSDLMILGMAFPNILGVVLLSGKVRKALDEYWARYKAGEFEIDPGAAPKVAAADSSPAE